MARGQRVDIGDHVYHVINRANGRLPIFTADYFYSDFEYLLNEMRETFDMRILAYVLMPNHWHLMLYPHHDGDLGKAMQWLGTSHTRRYHTQTNTVGAGHLYQGRYKSFLIEDDYHLLTVLKYIERNPVRAGLSNAAPEWRWGSSHRRIFGTPNQKQLLSDSPVPLPNDYAQWLADPEPAELLKEVRHMVSRGVPFGNESWVENIMTYIQEL